MHRIHSRQNPSSPRRFPFTKAAISVLALTFCTTGIAVARQRGPVPSHKKLDVTLNAKRLSRPVSPYEYGMFIENLGSLVYRTLWSQKLDDRKFYYPIQPKKSSPAHPRGPRFLSFLPRKWRPIGPSSSVIMDPVHPFVGVHSPEVLLSSAAPRGIRQGRISLVKGRRYVGYIYLRGTPGARVRVALIWGSGPQDRRTISFEVLAPAYTKFPLVFTPSTTTSQGIFEVTGQGSGNFHIGTVSLMPADNIDGFRPGAIAALRRLHSGFWRLPGGNFISDFNWYDSVGNPDKRPPKFDYAWNAVQSNDVGMDEFMTLCKLIGVQPYITVNAGFGDAHSAAQEVQYINGAITTPMGAWRARNGHPAPYNVKFWDIGNEPYGAWQLGRTTLKYYLLKHIFFYQAMKLADPGITLLASGSMPYQATNPLCSKTDWTCGFLQHDWGYFSGITNHWYSSSGRGFGPPAAHPRPVPKIPLLQWVRKPSNSVRFEAEEWQNYERRFPAMVRDKIFLSQDEYAYTGARPNLKGALAYAMILNEMLRHTDFLRMAALTMGTSTLDFYHHRTGLNVLGLLYKFYGEHLGAGAQPLALTGNSPQPLPVRHIVGDLPRKQAGSPTYPLDMVAAFTPGHRYINLAVINATRTLHRFDLRVLGVRLAGPSLVWELTGKDLSAVNHAGEPPQVTIRQVSLGPVPRSIAVPPLSVDIYHFPVVH